jgi:hypothetical protein
MYSNPGSNSTLFPGKDPARILDRGTLPVPDAVQGDGWGLCFRHEMGLPSAEPFERQPVDILQAEGALPSPFSAGFIIMAHVPRNIIRRKDASKRFYA